MVMFCCECLFCVLGISIDDVKVMEMLNCFGLDVM